MVSQSLVHYLYEGADVMGSHNGPQTPADTNQGLPWAPSRRDFLVPFRKIILSRAASTVSFCSGVGVDAHPSLENFFSPHDWLLLRVYLPWLLCGQVENLTLRSRFLNLLLTFGRGNLLKALTKQNKTKQLIYFLSSEARNGCQGLLEGKWMVEMRLIGKRGRVAQGAEKIREWKDIKNIEKNPF